MAASVAIIGAGQIGHAAQFDFADQGWDVTVFARSKPKWELWGGQFKHYVAGENAAPQADVVLDTIAFDEDDIARYDPDKIGRLIVVSSASVYCDAQGRTLDEAAQNGFPEFGGAITEEQSTVEPGPETYSTRKMRMEEKALSLFGNRATILRPCAIYGPYSRHPREWWLVKRMLDGRTRTPLMHLGSSKFHTTNVDDIAVAAQECAESNIGGVFNVGDVYCPSVREIGIAVAEQLYFEPEFVLVDSEGSIGRTPWSVPKPFVLSLEKLRLTVRCSQSSFLPNCFESVGWLKEYAPDDWRSAFPQLAAYPFDMFDYEAEDYFLNSM